MYIPIGQVNDTPECEDEIYPFLVGYIGYSSWRIDPNDHERVRMYSSYILLGTYPFPRFNICQY